MAFFDFYTDLQFNFPNKTPILVPISGGKDSTATLVLALKTGNPVYPVFNDTSFEHPITYEYLEYLEKRLGIKINKTKGPKGNETLEESILKNKTFPSGRIRFCTMYLKQYALRDWYNNNLYAPTRKVEFWYGIRTAESSQRKHKYSGLEPNDLFDMEELFPNRYNKKLRDTIKVRLPLITWTREWVFRFLKENEVAYNPLYDEGTNDRVGCYPCMLASSKIQLKMFKTPFGQTQLEKIKQLERRLGKKYEMVDTNKNECQLCKI